MGICFVNSADPQFAAKSNCKTPPKNDIMNAMKKNAHATFVLVLAIAGAVALSLRSVASPDIVRGGASS